MKKLIRNTSDPQSADFWDGVKRSAAGLRSAPDWMKAGIDLNDRNFITFEPTPSDSDDPSNGHAGR